MLRAAALSVLCLAALGAVPGAPAAAGLRAVVGGPGPSIIDRVDTLDLRYTANR